MVNSKISEIDWLCQKVKGAAIHGGADIAHVPVGGNDDRRFLVIRLLELLQERQSIHSRHVDVQHY